MSEKSTQRRKTVLHIAFWLAYASFFAYQISSSRRLEISNWSEILLDVAFHMVSMIGISYLNYLYFMPRLLSHKNFSRYMMEFLPVFLALMFLVIKGKQYILDGFSHELMWVYSLRFSVSVVLSAFFLVQFVGLLKFVENYFELEARKQELENESLISELKFLKSQINPHFLFNTLNNLYYLAYTKSPSTTEVIAKLSQMMRYMIYDSNHQLVPLQKELEYMENYISLEKLRLNDEVPIEYTINGSVDGVRIAPLILITFLENAFKHGIGNNKKNSWIKAQINVENNVCTYIVSNSKIYDTDKTVNEKSGIGLQNVKRRLDLSYENKYRLDVSENEDTYSIHLKLQLV